VNKLEKPIELDTDSVFKDWGTLLEQPQVEQADPLAGLQLAEQGQAYWEALFHKMNFPGMDLMAVVYFPRPDQNILEQHNLLRHMASQFIKMLHHEQINDLRSAGVTEEQLFYMSKGHIPENFTVHLKYPLNYGGTIDFKNMVFLQNVPYHELIHEYINKQLLGPEGLLTPKQLFVPAPVGKIYIPFGLFTGSGGKNKQDRSVMTGFDQSALQELALKTMPGR